MGEGHQAAVVVAVVSYNTRDLLDACLRSLRADYEAGLAEVWVVDNRSTDGSPGLVEERHPWVRLVRSERNLGFGPAVNLVARETRCDWIAPANADVRLTPGALGALVAAGEGELDAGAVAPRLLMPDGSTQPSIQPFPGLGPTLLRLSRLYRVSARAGRVLHLDGHWDPDRRAEGPWATGAFLIVRRAAFEAAGGFDERVWMYGEDLDLGWRLRHGGWATLYEPAAIVHHEHSAASTEAFGDALLERSVGASYDWIARRRGLRHARAVALAELADAHARRLLARAAARGSEAGRLRAERAALDVRRHRLGLRPAEEMLGRGPADGTAKQV